MRIDHQYREQGSEAPQKDADSIPKTVGWLTWSIIVNELKLPKTWNTARKETSQIWMTPHPIIVNKGSPNPDLDPDPNPSKRRKRNPDGKKRRNSISTADTRRKTIPTTRQIAR
jgi:hypothetical protein